MNDFSASTGMLFGVAVLCLVSAFVFFRLSRLPHLRASAFWPAAWAMMAFGTLIEAGHRLFGFGAVRGFGGFFLVAGFGFLGVALWKGETREVVDRKWIVGVLVVALLSGVGAILPPLIGRVVFGSVLILTLLWLARRVSDWEAGEPRTLFFFGLVFLAGGGAIVFAGGLLSSLSPSDVPAVILGLVGIGLLAAASIVSVAGGRFDELRPDLAESQTERPQFPGSSEVDPLTGCANRLALRSWFDCWHGGEVVSLVLVDVNNLNGINQRHGRDAGDEALLLVAGVLRDSLRPGDLVVRWGGDEFVAVLRGAGHEAAKRRFTSLIGSLQKTTETFPYDEPLLVDWGVASCSVPSGISSALAEADESMYAMKRRRRGKRTHDEEPGSAEPSKENS